MSSPERIRVSITRATLLVLANSIGTGIFTTTGFALADLGEPMLVFGVWVLGAIYSGFGVVCYEHLHKIFPGSGGEYHFMSKGLHPFFGHFAGWVTLIAGFSAPLAAASMGFALYLQKACGVALPVPVVASALLVCVFIFHGFFSTVGFKLHDIFSWGKLIGVTGLILVSLFAVDWSAAAVAWPSSFPAGKIANSFFWIAFAYTGWNAVYYIASELTDEKHSVKKASYAGTAAVCVIYLAVNVVLLFNSSTSQLQGVPEVVGRFVELTFGPWAGRGLSFLIAFGLVSTASAFYITAPRVYSRMAEDGVLPKVFYAPPGRTPRNSIILQGVLALIFLWSAQFDWILRFASFTLCLCSMLSVSVLLRKSSFRAQPLLYASALIFCGMTLWLTVNAAPTNVATLAAIGVIVLLSAVSWFSERAGWTRTW